MTYQIDKIRRDITSMQTDKGLQSQTDKFYEEKTPGVIPSSDELDI